MNDKNNDIITAQQNITNIDLIGKTIVSYATKGQSIDPSTASLLAILIAECRVYSTIRDGDILKDEGTEFIKKGIDIVTKQEEDSISDIADSIIADLRKSGINL
jgi:hypothetical protein